MRIAILTESRADWGGLEPIKKVLPNTPILNIWNGNQVFNIEPDWLIVLGDRLGVLEEVIRTANLSKDTGIAHLSGGDKQNGALIDEACRHSISKFAHIHFPGTMESAQRLIRQGEDPARIHVVGSTMVDNLRDFKPEKNKDFRQYNLVLIHPSPGWQELLVDTVKRSLPCRVLAPNRDKGFGERPDIPEYIDNMPREKFLQELWNCKAFIGNSSALYLEAQYIGTPCYQIGERNLGRQEAFPGHINSGVDARIETGLQENWKSGAHGDGTAAEKIIEILEKIGKPSREFLRKEWQ